MPPSNDKAAWTERAGLVGAAWKACGADGQHVFSAPLFFALAGVPDSTHIPSTVTLENEDESDVEMGSELPGSSATPLPNTNQLFAIPKVSPADELRYRPLFVELVDVEKVLLASGKPAKGPSRLASVTKGYAAFRTAQNQVSLTDPLFYVLISNGFFCPFFQAGSCCCSI